MKNHEKKYQCKTSVDESDWEDHGIYYATSKREAWEKFQNHNGQIFDVLCPQGEKSVLQCIRFNESEQKPEIYELIGIMRELPHLFTDDEE